MLLAQDVAQRRPLGWLLWSGELLGCSSVLCGHIWGWSGGAPPVAKEALGVAEVLLESSWLREPSKGPSGALGAVKGALGEVKGALGVLLEGNPTVSASIPTSSSSFSPSYRS